MAVSTVRMLSSLSLGVGLLGWPSHPVSTLDGRNEMGKILLDNLCDDLIYMDTAPWKLGMINLIYLVTSIRWHVILVTRFWYSR